MGCACNKNKGRQQFEVIAENGRVVFTSGNKATADTVAGRYPNSEVKARGDAGTTPPAAAAKTLPAAPATRQPAPVSITPAPAQSSG
ncbi:hypothetical protein [Streptomyces sp. H27-H5]|uniref:hypothetical protein n=1 Tax=Streptomyces sp. H27-H5 TaxID=2996460 RepID=UPI00226E895D|nr:hypothetical protein [Streptomyces sp. H27-H5]MCY0957733.1 hypothetical protein [Streptomyces sp. H27-H5]